LYRVFLGREADSNGLGVWIKLLESGTDRENVIDGFAYSLEFTALLESYGL
jgi:hypothetical protein